VDRARKGEALFSLLARLRKATEFMSDERYRANGTRMPAFPGGTLFALRIGDNDKPTTVCGEMCSKQTRAST
jgi:hypothetical protein